MFKVLSRIYNLSEKAEMEVISISSDSDMSVNEDVNTSPPPNWNDEVYNIDWNDDDVYPPINYESNPVNIETENQLKPEEEIEDFITPIKDNKRNTDSDVMLNNEEENINYIDQINNCGFTDDGETNKSQIKEASNKNSDFNFPMTSQTVSTKQTKNKLSQEEKDKAKTLKKQKKLEREKLKEEKKAEQLRQRAFKAALTENQRNLKPEENIKFLKVHIDNEIINSICGGNIIPLLQQNNIQYVVEPQIKSFTINWSKRRTEKIVNNYKDISEKLESKDEDQLLYVLDWQKAVPLVLNNELLSYVETVKSNYIDKKLTLIIYGLGKYFDYKRAKRNRDMKAEINDKRKLKPKPCEKEFDDAPNVSRDQLEYVLTDLQLLGKHNCRMLETPEELSSLVLNITKSLSQIDYKLEKQKRQEDLQGWFATSDGQCVKVDKNGNGLLRLWQQQICQFSSVGLETAQAIVSHFNSPLALITQYENCGSSCEGELLLQNLQIRREAGILSSTRKVGPQLSKKIYNFFSSDDPELKL